MRIAGLNHAKGLGVICERRDGPVRPLFFPSLNLNCCRLQNDAALARARSNAGSLSKQRIAEGAGINCKVIFSPNWLTCVSFLHGCATIKWRRKAATSGKDQASPTGALREEVPERVCDFSPVVSASQLMSRLDPRLLPADSGIKKMRRPAVIRG